MKRLSSLVMQLKLIAINANFYRSLRGENIPKAYQITINLF
jgi:hypothetical protein